MHTFPLFQRQWNHNPNFDIPTLLWRFHVSISFVCFVLFVYSHRTLYLFIQDYGDPVQLCSFCHTTSVLSKWGYQFQKQGSTARFMESFEERTFSKLCPNSTCVSINFFRYKKNSTKQFFFPFYYYFNLFTVYLHWNITSIK